MSNNTELEALFEQIRQLLAAEYARGDRDAVGRIMQAVKSETSVESIRRTPSGRVRPTLQSRRAPAGAVDSLITRVLAERRNRGAGAQEIMQAAASPTERSVSYSGVRFALDRGKKNGTYRNKEGRWFLVENRAAEHQHAAE